MSLSEYRYLALDHGFVGRGSIRFSAPPLHERPSIMERSKAAGLQS